jgi:hypothetical protein
MDSGRLNKKLRSQKFLQAQRRWKELRAHFAPLEASNDMKYQRVLGFGGFGIVQLWHVLKDDGKLDRAVALKTLIWPYRAPDVWAIRREIQWHKAS